MRANKNNRLASHGGSFFGGSPIEDFEEMPAHPDMHDGKGTFSWPEAIDNTNRRQQHRILGMGLHGGFASLSFRAMTGEWCRVPRRWPCHRARRHISSDNRR